MNTKDKDADIAPLSPEEIKAIGSIGIGPSKQDIFLNRHYRKLIWGGVGLALVAGVAIAYASHRNDMREEAGSQVVAAMKGERLGKVATPADYDAKLMEAIGTEHASTPSAATARLLEGLSLLSGSEEQATAGAAILQELVDGSDTAPLLRARALAALATRAMVKGDTSAATTYWSALTMLGDSPYTALAYLSLGDMAKNAGKVDEARNYYTQATTACPTSPLTAPGGVVASRLELLDVDDPRPVEPTQPGSSPLDSPLDAPAETDPFGDTPSPVQPTPPAQGTATDALFGESSTLPAGNPLPGTLPQPQ